MAARRVMAARASSRCSQVVALGCRRSRVWAWPGLLPPGHPRAFFAGLALAAGAPLAPMQVA
eukprot:8160369-Alexandrium_andersonii.AAC.1